MGLFYSNASFTLDNPINSDGEEFTMKKVLFALKNMHIGGVEKSLLSLLGTMSPNEYEVDILLLENSGGFLDQLPDWVNVIVYEPYASIKDAVNQPPLQVIRREMKMGNVSRATELLVGYSVSKLLGDTSYYYRLVFHGLPHLQKHYDVAVAYTSIIGYLSWLVMYHVSADRKIGWIHFDVSKLQMDYKLMLRLHRDMDRIFAVSQQAQEEFEKKFPVLAEKCELRYNVVDAVAIKKLAEEPVENIRKPGKLTIVTLGRLSAEKGQDIIPEAAEILRERGIRFCWYLIGDGKLREKILEDTHRRKLDDSVILLGTKKNPYPFLKQADMYVQTSVHEGYCITLAEALAMELPCVSTDFAGAREQLEGRENCKIVIRDARQLIAAIEKLLG